MPICRTRAQCQTSLGNEQDACADGSADKHQPASAPTGSPCPLHPDQQHCPLQLLLHLQDHWQHHGEQQGVHSTVQCLTHRTLADISLNVSTATQPTSRGSHAHSPLAHLCMSCRMKSAPAHMVKTQSVRLRLRNRAATMCGQKCVLTTGTLDHMTGNTCEGAHTDRCINSVQHIRDAAQ